MNEEKKQAERIQTSILNPYEKRILVYLAGRMPAWVTSDMLTLVGFLGAIIMATGYSLSNLNLHWLWLSCFGLLVNWFGDSLDGSLARVRKTQRKTYGFYIDHNVDVINETIMFIGVVISDKAQLSDISTVELNSAAAGRLIAEHLLDLGHKSIAFITTPLKASSNTQRIRRLEGLKERLAGTDVRLTVLESREDYSRSYYLKDFEYSVGYGFTEQICMGGERPTAFIGVNDMVAYGILDALKDRDIRVPDQASVCGFDNIFPSRFHSIELTTVDSFLYEKGRDAFELLHRTMQGSTLSQSVFTIEYKPQLIVRKSTGPAPGPDK